jgi:hypothetical protein
MRERLSRWCSGRAVVALAVVAAGLTLSLGPAAASDREVEHLRAVAASPVGLSRQLMALERLAVLDTAASRAALLDLCDAADERLAVCSLATLGRTDLAGAEGKLKSVLAATGRSDFVRSGALVALSVHGKNRGRSWSQVKDDVESRTGSNQELADVAEAARGRLWGER